MKKIDELKELIEKNGGVITTAQAKEHNIHRQYLKILCDRGYIERDGRGIYTKTDKFVDFFYLEQQKYKSGVFSHNTALYFYNLTDRTPYKYDITFRDNVRVKDDLVFSHYSNDKRFEVGLVELKLPTGKVVRTYDMERTIIDIIKDKNKVDMQIFVDALREYVLRKDKDLYKLMRYAEIFKQEKKVREYMEVLL